MEPTVRTDRTVPNNKLDIIVSDNKQGKYVLIDVAIRGDRNTGWHSVVLLFHMT
jgi:hypothetical protein